MVSQPRQLPSPPCHPSASAQLTGSGWARAACPAAPSPPAHLLEALGQARLPGALAVASRAVSPPGAPHALLPASTCTASSSPLCLLLPVGEGGPRPAARRACGFGALGLIPLSESASLLDTARPKTCHGSPLPTPRSIPLSIRIPFLNYPHIILQEHSCVLMMQCELRVACHDPWDLQSSGSLLQSSSPPLQSGIRPEPHPKCSLQPPSC